MKKPITLISRVTGNNFKWRKSFLGLTMLLCSLYANAGDVVWEIFKPKLASFAELSTTTQTPSQTVNLSSLDAQGTLLGVSLDDYHSRIKGFIVAPITGQYQFALASDDGSEFWLSSDASTAGKTLVHKNNGYVGSFATNTTTAIRTLEAGKYYYFEVLHDEGSGGDFVRVGWTKPGDAAGSFTDIQSANLANFQFNQTPTIDPIAKPAPVMVNTPGVQTINLTGITDGDAGKNQIVTITATSNDPNIITNLTVTPSTLTTGTTAKLEYTVGAKNGIAEISVTVKDDGGALTAVEKDSYTVKFLVEVRDPLINDAPSFGLPVSSNIFLGRSYDYILIPNVDDGEDDQVQNITFSITNNSNPAALEVLEVIYNKGDKSALLKVKPKTAGTATITINAKDDGGVVNNGIDSYLRDITFNVGFYNFPGINFEYYDVAHWQPLPDDATAVPGSYQVIQTAESPIKDLAKDFFWQRMWGYITPTVSGDYVFKSEGSDNNAIVYLSPDADPAKKVEIINMAQGRISSDAQFLEAGKTYYWMAKNADIVNSNEFYVKVAKPDQGFDFLTGDLSSPIYDTTRPTQPKNLRTVTRGVNDLLIQWDASTDKNLLGYFVYVNGIPVKDTVLGTTYMVKGLQPEGTYSVVVRAFDKYSNGSDPTNTLTINTYPVDNNPPSTPTNLALMKAYDLGLQIKWDASTDAETEIRGYNIYFEGSTTPINKEIVNGTSYLITGLSNKTAYKIQVEAVDAGNNKSPKSAAVTMSTEDFSTSSSIPGFKKGRVQFTMDPIAKSTGFSLNMHIGGVVLRNKLKNGDFEGPDAKASKETSSNLVLVATNKATAPADVFAGLKSGKLQGATNDYLRFKFGFPINQAYTYKVRFAMKKASTYSGAVKVKIVNTWGVLVYEKDFTPTTEWAMYEDVVTTSYKDADAGMNMDFILLGSGTIFLDEVELGFDNDDYMIDGKLSMFSKKGMDLLKEFKPSGLRWGAIDASFKEFRNHAGITGRETYGDHTFLSNHLGAKSIITTGVYEGTDWYKDSTTFTKFMDYLGGEATTPGGILRAQEGYPNLLAGSPGLVIEFGNEVWGGGCLITEDCGVNHGARQWSGKPLVYGDWARRMANMVKKSSAYTANQNKIWTAYSGGTTDMNSFGGWSRRIYEKDKNHQVDWLAIMGYMGGNLDYSLEIPRGSSELDYHKNSIKLFATDYFPGITNLQKDMIKSTGAIFPMYMYEGNMTRSDYFGRLGQAVTFTDFYASLIERGVAVPAVFSFEGGEWKILEDVSYKPYPLFHTSALFNTYATGTVLKTSFISGDSLVDEQGKAINLESVGAHTYVNGDTYSVLLISRDFENDYRVQIELPDSIKAINGYTIHSITGNAFQTKDVVINNTVNTTNNPDSLLVTVPKYGMIVVQFKANSYNLNPPAEGVLVNNKAVSRIEIGGGNSVGSNGNLNLTVKVYPDDAFSKDFTVVDNNATATVTKNADGTVTLNGNGTTATSITLTFTSQDGSATKAQHIVSVLPNGIKEEAVISGVKIYPNPTHGALQISIPAEVKGSSQIQIFNVSGMLISERSIQSGEHTIDLSGQSQGLYIIKVINDNASFVQRVEKF